MSNEDKQLGRKGKSAHRRLVELASKKLIDEELAEGWSSITMIRENPLDIQVQTNIKGERFGGWNVAKAEQRNYCDVACAVTYDPKEGPVPTDPVWPEFMEGANKLLAEGKETEYRDMIRRAYGVSIYIIECEINPRSNLLRDGPRLTAYRLIKQQNSNLTLILGVFEGTRIDNPQVFDMIWEFPRKIDEKMEDEEDGETGKDGELPSP